MKTPIPNTSRFAVYNAPIACIFKRLARDHAAGRMLAGMKLPVKTSASGASVLFASSAFEDIGEGELPCVRYRGTLTTETRSDYAGALGPTMPKQGAKDSPTTAVRQIQISILTSIAAGALNPHPTVAGSKLGHEDWVALVMDAIEMDDSGKTDATLDGSSAWPIVYNTTLPEVESEIYYETILTIAARVPSMYRAQRRLCTSEE
jgi:hypothetical protein